MSETNKPSLRIDWFDGSLTEQSSPMGNLISSVFSNEEETEYAECAAAEPPKPVFSEKKPIGFKRLLELSLLQHPVLTLEIANRPGFWNLFDSELKGDFVVLIIKILANIYNALEPGERSKIVTMLKKRFEQSNFLDVLKDYIVGLPSVRISDKRHNMRLWDDIQLFFSEVVSLCKGIYEFGGHRHELLEKVYNLLEICEISALGVTEEHREIFTEDFFACIVELKISIKDSMKKPVVESSNVQSQSTITSDETSFRNLSVFPCKQDLVEPSGTVIQPNLIDGAYSSVEHYLDVQFKLLREDCFGPLREGICQYIENPSKRKHENIRIYPNVRIKCPHITKNKVGHLVDMAWNDEVTREPIEKQLMFGSLLIFTNDNFETVLCGTVLDSSNALLRAGQVVVSFENPVSYNIYLEPYLMVESEVFFEPYNRVLRVLQNSRSDDLPMKRYIVDVQKHTKSPSYLTSHTVYSIEHKNSEIRFPVLDFNQWPATSQFGLNESQMSAFAFALTREFAVIQGPPGTGKTFLGIKIASTLLRNLSLESTPMVIVCQTNHALDQFLEGLMEVTTNIVRLGSQSKSKMLENCTLYKMRNGVKSKYGSWYAKMRSEMEALYKKIMDVQTDIEKCEKEIISYKCIKSYFNNDQAFINGNEDAMLTWLFEHVDDKNHDEMYQNVSDWESQFYEFNIEDKLESCFSEQLAKSEILSMECAIDNVKYVTVDQRERQKMTDKFILQINRVQKRLLYFKTRIGLLQNEDKNNIDISQVGNLHKLNADQRWAVYAAIVKKVKNDIINNRMNGLMEQHNACSKELEELSSLMDYEVIRCARVVGATTTVAARRHDLFKKIMSPIVIVEEAAEVLETHIVASLTDQCQHLILIGDHKQLRPSAAHYKLAKECNLEISLFERMIRNGVHARTLTTQRRMRPEFVELLVPTIYERLDNHPVVYEYENVRGMMNNLFFFNHKIFEDSAGLEDSTSHKNKFEAKWCVALANYLRLMDYEEHEITILATYADQATLIKELSKKYTTLHDVKITVVDNYQGEENKIVILSLVRSNSDGKIGFLYAANRICVALSRAKEGFYIFGNMDVLKSASKIWRSINEKLVSRNAIGKQLRLRCEAHGDNILSVTYPEKLDNSGAACLRIRK